MVICLSCEERDALQFGCDRFIAMIATWTPVIKRQITATASDTLVGAVGGPEKHGYL